MDDLGDIGDTVYIAYSFFKKGIAHMGKTYLYHPISLMTVRGAAAQNGFELGRIQQTRPPTKNYSAEYRAEVKSWPKGWNEKSQAVQKAWFNNGFSLDIWCTWAGVNTHGKLCVNFTTQLVPDEDMTQAEPQGGSEIVDPYYD